MSTTKDILNSLNSLDGKDVSYIYNQSIQMLQKIECKELKLSQSEAISVIDYMEGIVKSQTIDTHSIYGILSDFGANVLSKDEMIVNLEGWKQRITATIKPNTERQPEKSPSSIWDKGDLWGIINTNKVRNEHSEEFFEVIDRHRRGSANEIAIIAKMLFISEIPLRKKGWSYWYMEFCEAINVPISDTYKRDIEKTQRGAKKAKEISKEIADSGFLILDEKGGDAMNNAPKRFNDNIKINPDASNHKRGNNHQSKAERELESMENGEVHHIWEEILKYLLSLIPEEKRTKKAKDILTDWAKNLKKEGKSLSEVRNEISRDDVLEILEWERFNH